MSEIEVVALGDSPGAAAYHQVSMLFHRIWGEPLMEAGLLRALAHAGNYVAGAYLDGELVGASAGFLTAGGELHSHITGVLPRARRYGVGRALKHHQRDWALERGIGTVVWTFDPLIRRNAHFNMHVLGAMPTRYLPDFYGMMKDELNDASPSDRLYVVWDLRAPVPPSPGTSAGLIERGAVVLLAAGEAHPVRGAAPGPPETGADDVPAARRLLVFVPEGVERLRAARPELAGRLRFAVREALAPAMDAGMRITGITRDGYYVLEGGTA